MNLKLNKQECITHLKCVGPHAAPGLGEAREMTKLQNIKSHSHGAHTKLFHCQSPSSKALKSGAT